MNSLKFIDKEIAITKHKYKEHIKYNQTSFAIKDEKRLKYLQQIKTELEAWEVCKNYLVDIGNEYVLSIDSYYHKKEYETLKKALEVKDNENIN